jgi:hypothetical protein
MKAGPGIVDNLLSLDFISNVTFVICSSLEESRASKIF